MIVQTEHPGPCPEAGPLARRRTVLTSYGKFSLVGVANATVDYGTLTLLLVLWPTASAAHLALDNLLALLLTNANSYVWNTAWTFRGSARHDRTQLLLFAAQAALNIAVGSAVLWLAGRLLFAHTALPPSSWATSPRCSQGWCRPP